MGIMIDRRETMQQAKMHLRLARDHLDEMQAFEAAAYVSTALDIIICVEKLEPKVCEKANTEINTR